MKKKTSKKMKPREDGSHPAPLRVKVDRVGTPPYVTDHVWLVCAQQGFCVFNGPPEDAKYEARFLRQALKRGAAWERGER